MAKDLIVTEENRYYRSEKKKNKSNKVVKVNSLPAQMCSTVIP